MKNSFDKNREIKVLISKIKSLSGLVHEILKSTNTQEIGRYSSFKEMAIVYNDLADETRKVLETSIMFYKFNIEMIPTWGDSSWPTQKKILEQVFLMSKLLLSCLEENVDFVDDEFDNIENFLSSRIRSVVYQKPEKEKEVQNAIESLLLGRGLSKGVDYDRESGKFSFSGREYIPDFIIPKMSLCIEVKLLKENRKSKVIEEISADITAYKKVYERQVYIVYDLGFIQNEVEFKRDIENATDGVKVIIIKH